MKSFVTKATPQTEFRSKAEALLRDATVSSNKGSRTILFVTNTDEYGGAEQHLLELIKRLTEPGLQIEILCLRSDFYSERLASTVGSETHIIRLDKQPESFLDWYWLFREIRPDVVLFVWAYLWCFEWYVPVAAWLAAIPMRVAIAQLTPPESDADLSGAPNAVDKIRYAFRRKKREVSAYFHSRIICVSHGVRKALISRYSLPQGRLLTIHNGATLPEVQSLQRRDSDIRGKLDIGPKEFLLVCVARLSEQKRIDILLQALAELKRKSISCKCIIVGDGPLYGDLVQQMKDLHLTDRVFFEGFQKEVRPYLKASDAFVLSSDREGLPLALVEAMAHGLPCVVTDVGGNAEAITNRVEGLVVPPRSPERLASAIDYLIAHPRERAEMSKTAEARSRREFDIEARMADIKKLLLN